MLFIFTAPEIATGFGSPPTFAGAPQPPGFFK